MRIVAVGLGAAGAHGQIRLKADSATTKEARVSWEGAAGKKAQLERQGSGDRWDAVGEPADSAAADTQIAAYATYRYRVRLGGSRGRTGHRILAEDGHG